MHVQGVAETVPIRRLMLSRARELLIVETATLLRRASRYGIAFSQYRGVIGRDLRGLYRSTYRDERGQQRYVCMGVHQCGDFVCCDRMGRRLKGKS